MRQRSSLAVEVEGMFLGLSDTLSGGYLTSGTFHHKHIHYKAVTAIVHTKK